MKFPPSARRNRSVGATIRTRPRRRALGRPPAPRAGNYDAAYENAAEQAEQLLARAGRELAPKLLNSYATADLGRSG
jgi:hypothetical protein